MAEVEERRVSKPVRVEEHFSNPVSHPSRIVELLGLAQTRHQVVSIRSLLNHRSR